MTNQISTQVISFHGSELVTLKVEDVIYTAVKPIVKAMGLDWGGQQQKLSKSNDKFNCRDISMVAKDGKIREMLCMPLKKLNGWLFSINPEKVRADLREKVIQYQEECFEALYNYWHFGKAERKTTTDQRTGLRNAVSMLVGKKALMYNEAYSLVHQRFNVGSIEDLTEEQLPQAVEYVHKIYLEGELIIDTPKERTHSINDARLLNIVSMWFALYNSLDLLSKIHKPLNMLNSHYGVTAYTHATEYRNTLGRMKNLLEPMTEGLIIDPIKEGHYHLALKTLRNFEPTGLGSIARF